MKQNFFFGLAIASCVTAGGFAVGAVSGGELNPAVSAGVATLGVVSPGKDGLPTYMYTVAFVLMELLGGVLAAAVFWITHPQERGQDAPTSLAKLTCEFVGTFMLVFTVGCAGLTGSAIWNATAVAGTLLAMVYATGPVS